MSNFRWIDTSWWHKKLSSGWKNIDSDKFNGALKSRWFIWNSSSNLTIAQSTSLNFGSGNLTTLPTGVSWGGWSLLGSSELPVLSWMEGFSDVKQACRVESVVADIAWATVSAWGATSVWKYSKPPRVAIVQSSGDRPIKASVGSVIRLFSHIVSKTYTFQVKVNPWRCSWSSVEGGSESASEVRSDEEDWPESCKPDASRLVPLSSARWGTSPLGKSRLISKINHECAELTHSPNSSFSSLLTSPIWLQLTTSLGNSLWLSIPQKKMPMLKFGTFPPLSFSNPEILSLACLMSSSAHLSSFLKPASWQNFPLTRLHGGPGYIKLL